jgi:hypothetical protein
METYFANMNAAEGSKEKLVQDLMTLVRDAESLVKTAGGSGKQIKQDLMVALGGESQLPPAQAQAAVHAHGDRVTPRASLRSIGRFGLGCSRHRWAHSDASG